MKTLATFYDESPTKNKTRYKIVKAGIDLFSEAGIESVTMTDIAAKCGITIRNVYRYYANKELLAVDIAYYMFVVSGLDEVRITEQPQRGIEQLALYLKEYFYKEQSDTAGIKLIQFIMYFDLYLMKMPMEHPAYIKYTQVYVKEINDVGKKQIIDILKKGIEDHSIELDGEQVEFYGEYIVQSMFSMITRVLVKESENPAINRQLIYQHIEMIVAYLKGKGE